MDTGIKHLHVLIVTLYLLQLLVKVVLMAMKKEEALEKFGAKTKVPHIVLAVLLLLTGIFLLVKSPLASAPWMITKLVLVFASIPLGIVGMKKGVFPMLLLSLLFLAYAFGLALKKNFMLKSSKALSEMHVNEGTTANASTPKGKKLYDIYCQRCHGKDGDAGFQGAKNLGESKLTDAEIATIITEGKGLMPKVDELNKNQVEDLVSYTKTFRN